jgi:hypothetical protein
MKARIAALSIAATIGIVACSEVTESQPLPWLKVKKTFHKPIGGIAGGTSDFEYYTKRLGFWWVKVDENATGSAVALDGNHAAVSTTQGLKILERGEEHGTLACGTSRSAPSVVAQAGVIDCFDVIAGPAAAVATQIRWRRISARGEALVVEKVSVENPGRLFARAMASFYDAGHQPYFVTLNADAAGSPQCALVSIAGGETRSIAAPEDLARGRCSDVDAWAPLLKRTLRKA